MQKRSKQPIKREHLKDVNIIEYIDKKMNEAASGTSGSPSMEENENSKNSTRKSTPEFKIPSSKGPLDGASSSGADSKKPKNFSAQYCNEVMNSDSIKPFNSGKFKWNYKVICVSKRYKIAKTVYSFTNKYTLFDHGKFLVSEFKTGDFISF